MKLATRPIESNMGAAAIKSQRFTMKTTAVSIGLTIKGMYSDPVLAVIRELISNALDSHIGAGTTDTPIKLHLPTELEPHFSVRDYGTSMTDEMIWNVYTEVYNSPKSDSNEQTGAFGLGSKSPFAIGDSFITTAYLDGEARTYVASFDSDGFPELHHLSTVPTDEPDGLEVSVTPPESMRREFVPKVTEFVRGLDVAPVSNVPLRISEPVLSGDGWKLFRSAHGYNRSVMVRQGAVVYPTSVYVYNFDSGHELVVDVPIGSVEVATSREALVVDSESRELIQGLSEAASDDARAQIVAAIKDAPTFYAANEVRNQFKDVVSSLPTVEYRPGMPVTGSIQTRVDVTYSPTKRGSAPRTGFVVSVQPGGVTSVPTFIIDTPGDTTPRKRLRVAKLGRERTAYVLHSPTPAQVKALVRAYRRTDIFVHVSKLDDVEVNRKARTSSNDGLVSGVYAPSGYDKLGRLDADPAPGSYIAVPIDSIKISAKVLSENAVVKGRTQDDLLTVFSDLRRYFDKPVVLLSKSGMKRLNPGASDLIDSYIDRYVAANLPAATASHRFDTISNATLHGRNVTEALLGEKAPTRFSFSWYFNRLDIVQDAETRADAEAQAEIDKLIELFPLVFKSNEDAVLSYIKLLKEETK